MTSQPHRSDYVLELIYNASRGRLVQDRSYLLPEDLLDSPIELTLAETPAAATTQRKAPVAPLH